MFAGGKVVYKSVFWWYNMIVFLDVDFGEGWGCYLPNFLLDAC